MNRVRTATGKDTVQLSFLSQSEADCAFNEILFDAWEGMPITIAKRILPYYFQPGSSDYSLCFSLVREWEDTPKDEMTEVKILMRARSKAQDFGKVKRFFEEFWRLAKSQEELFKQ